MKGDIFSWNSSLSWALNTISAKRRHAAKNSSMLWMPWFHGPHGLRWFCHSILPGSVIIPEKALRRCFACTLCRFSSIGLMLLLKMASTIVMLHGLSCALISRRNRFRNQLLCGNSGIFLNSTIMVRKSLQIWKMPQRKRGDYAGRHHCGCHHNQCYELYQEQGGKNAGPKCTWQRN